MIFLLKCMCCSQISSFLLLRQRERETKWKQSAGISQAATGLQIDIDNDRSDVQSRIGNKGISKTKSENIYRMRKKWRWWCFGCDDDKSAPTFARVINHAAGWNCRQLMSMILVKPAEQVKPSRSLSLLLALSLARSTFIIPILFALRFYLSRTKTEHQQQQQQKSVQFFAVNVNNELLLLLLVFNVNMELYLLAYFPSTIYAEFICWLFVVCAPCTVVQWLLYSRYWLRWDAFDVEWQTVFFWFATQNKATQKVTM